MTMLKKANAFIAENQGKTNPRYRPRFHAAPPTGWCNDPNGFFFDGEWTHVFYQFYPYDSQWNSMHWGHWRSRDLLHWEDQPAVMAPDQPYDAYGCFSGTAWPTGDGGAHVLYTGVHDGVQEQCLARYENGQMTKAEDNPVIPASALPEGYSHADFRDPKLLRTPEGWRAVMAVGHGNGGHLVSFASQDLHHWRFEGPFAMTPGELPECPDSFVLDGREVTLFSQIGREDAPGNPRPVLYTLGEGWHELDRGRNFYAAQSCVGPNGERVLIAWMASWMEAWPTHLLGHGWAGMQTLPRILHVEGDRLVQTPPRMEALRGERWEDVGQARHAELLVSAPQKGDFALRLMETGDEFVTLTQRDGTLTLDRSRLPLCAGSPPCMSMEAAEEVRVFVDGCSIEVFAGGNAMSALAFPQGEAYGARLEPGSAARLTGWEMKR